MTPSGRGRAAIPVALFAVSGAAGLVYEVTWSRLLALQMGNTAQALSTILTIFMGGLALGALLGGRLARRVEDLLRTYGLLEIAVGISAALLPAAIASLRPLMAIAYGHSAGSAALFSAVQFIAAGAVLLVPAALMGATLPVLAQHAARRGESIGRSVGLVYGANTAGAFVGAIAAGFVLIPQWGIARANVVAVGASIAVGAIALILSMSRFTVRPAAGDEPRRSPPDRSSPRPTIILVALAASGFAAMTYQVAWTRLVTLAIGPSTYAFSLVVGAFILGLALGAPVLGALGDRVGRRGGLLIASQLGVAVAAAISIPALGELPLRISSAVARHGESFWRLELAEFVVVFALIVAPTFLLGGALPLACRALLEGMPATSRHGLGRRPVHLGRGGTPSPPPAVAPGSHAPLAPGSHAPLARRLGQAYASNAAGAISGAFLAGFVLLPLLGVQRTIALGVAVNVLAGAALLLGSHPRPEWWRTILVLATGLGCVVLAVAARPWDVRVITSAPYVNAPTLAPGAGEAGEQFLREMVARRPAPLFHREDAVTTVTVTEEWGRRILWTAGESAGLESDPAQILLAHVPLLVHPAPRDVLVIGLGAGGTLASALRHDRVERLDCVEVSPAVREAMELWFQQDARPLDDPRVNLRIGDGRVHVSLSDARYDVILSQPGNPWMAGSSALFTREAFEDMRSRLKDGGIAAVWVQGWMPIDALRSLLATFHAVFTEMDLWEAGAPGHYLLTGTTTPTAFSPRALEARMARPALEADLQRLGIRDAADLLGYHLLDGRGADRASGRAGISTDDLDLVGTRTARALRRNDWPAIVMDLHARRTPITDRLVAPPGDGREELLERMRVITAAKDLIAESVRAQEASMQAMRSRLPDEAAEFMRESERLREAARELNPRDPAFGFGQD